MVQASGLRSLTVTAHDLIAKWPKLSTARRTLSSSRARRETFDLYKIEIRSSGVVRQRITVRLRTLKAVLVPAFADLLLNIHFFGVSMQDMTAFVRSSLNIGRMYRLPWMGIACVYSSFHDEQMNSGTSWAGLLWPLASSLLKAQ